MHVHCSGPGENKAAFDKLFCVLADDWEVVYGWFYQVF